MGESKRNIAVGLTAMAGLAGLLALLLLFGWVPAWVQRGYPIIVQLPNAGGLHQSSRVRLDGIDIGEVESVKFAPKGQRGVRVLALINPKIRLPANLDAHVASSIFGSSPSIEMTASGEIKSYLATTGPPPVIQGRSTSLATSLANRLQSQLQGPLKRFDKLSDSIQQLSSQWTTVGANINKLVEPNATSSVDTGKTVGNLASALARFDKRLAEIKSVIANVRDVTGDKQFRDNLKQTVANARNVSTKLNHDVDQLSDSVKGNVDKLSKRYTDLADHLSLAVDSMRKLTDQAREGKGTLGKMLKDPALYNNLNDAVQQLNSAIEQGKLLLEKWKAEGVPIQF